MALSTAARLHRADLDQLVRLAERDVSLVFAGDLRDVGRVRDDLADVLVEVIARYGSAAGALGADWYDDLRESAGVGGRFQGIVADLPGAARARALAGWSVGPLFGAAPDPAAAARMVSGGLQRVIFDADRHTVMQSSIDDRWARGWRREGSGECTFCRMLIGRGAVYSEESVEFKSHDRCKCVGVPDFGGAPATG